MSRKKWKTGVCPICDKPYHNRAYRTMHHVYPKFWYKIGIVVEVCNLCHREFNALFPMEFKWSELSCLNKWCKFCTTHGKDAYVLYPHLK